MPSKHVFLIGMPGVGKTTVGRLLALTLGQTFVDSDEEIVRRNGVEINTIFEIEGEAGFREREVNVIREVTQRSPIVLATGGGVILREENRKALRENGIVVYLHASLDVLEARTDKKRGSSNSTHQRPLLAGSDRRATLAALLDVRQPLYRETAHIIVDANTTQRSKFMQKLLTAIESCRQGA
jgi:shikimate kinase